MSDGSRSRISLGVVVGALIVFVLVELLARLLVDTDAPALRWMNVHTQLKAAQLHEVGQRDVVFIGTSMVLRGLDTETFSASSGRSSYNAALPGGTPELMARWVAEEVLPQLEPTVVIWGLGSYDVAPNYGVEQRAAYDDAPASAPGLLASVDNGLSTYSTFLRERSVLRSPGALVADRTDQFEVNARQLGPGGERIIEDAEATAEQPEVLAARLRDFEPDPEDLDTIAQTVALIRAAGSEVVFVEMPVASDFVAAHPNGPADASRTSSAIQQLAHELAVPLIVDLGAFDDTDFADQVHLRRSSALVFTTRLADRLDAAVVPEAAAPDSLAATGVDPPAGGDCRIVVVEDEYGLDVEVEQCGDAAPEETVSIDGAESDVEPAGVERQTNDPAVLDNLTERLFLQTDCSPDAAASLAPLAAVASWQDSFERVERAFHQTRPFCGTDAYAEQYRLVLVELELALGSASPASSRTELFDMGSNDVANLAAWAVDLHDRFMLFLTDRRPPSVSEIWFHVDESGIRATLEREHREGRSADIVLFGDSTAANSMDVGVLRSQLGAGVTKIAVPSADPEEWTLMWDRLYSGLDEPTEAIWPITTHRFLSPGARNCRQLLSARFTDTNVLRRRSFPQFRDSVERTELFFGSDINELPFVGSSMEEQYATRHNELGNRRLGKQLYSGLDVSRNPWYPDPQLCQQRVDSLDEMIDMLQSRGINVTLVRLPLHPDFWNEAPQAHEIANQALADTAAARGIRFIELFDDYTNEDTPDGYHVNAVGRERVTTAFLERYLNDTSN